MSFTTREKYSVATIAGIYATRMLGLFMLLPVFSSFIKSFPATDSALAGLAFGCYGLTQALLQIPLGMLSDRVGRRPVLLFGLAFMMLGSLIAATATSITALICGRFLQGFGAIGSTLTATLVDVTRFEVRAKAMAIVGATIGGSFFLSLITGVALNDIFGVRGIFFTMLILAVAAVPLVYSLPQPKIRQNYLKPSLKSLWQDSNLNLVYLAVCFLHASLAAMFLLIPEWISNLATSSTPSYFYALSLGLAVLFICPILSRQNKSRRLWQLVITATIILVLAEIVLITFHATYLQLLVGTTLYFAAFSLQEAILPALLSSLVDTNQRGFTFGVFGAMQFAGVFLGATVGGFVASRYTPNAVILFCITLACSWLLIVAIKWLQNRALVDAKI